ncbi:Uncharacterised protein [BD1-7 clade bacterium]|uniref:Nucleotide modification associated domain-containing protein n=1 Tax=BD1-7 clade bacterium TaxID=2029982 RepID=A0A5S9N095_9GAMM|nr:Uncharacterised protein [BD1-7 clade bacterium]CAA0083479.1 Uncharacterised protein [BD1-7 clade bacterium]
MKLILSRKGFDSSAGGIPSPILPDGRIRALPIPDATSPIRFDDLTVTSDAHGKLPMAQCLRQLGAKPEVIVSPVHLDPDIIADDLPRQPDWQPLFGQSGAAQGHLQKQNVGIGDLLLFFGLFQHTEMTENGLRFRRDSSPVHVLWGWMQIGQIHRVDALTADELAWARYHPHFYLNDVSNNTLYVASPQLNIDGVNCALPGAGYFPEFRSELQLTATDAPSVTHWQLPVGFYPTPGKPAMTYHGNLERWHQLQHACRLRCASRGQEFVLDLDHYPDVVNWLANLLQNHTI